jgi:YVTN family beta-propeller protein
MTGRTTRLCLAGLAAGAVAATWPGTIVPAAAQAAPAAQSRAPAHPGANVLVNPGAQAGDPSVQGWDSVTIPGWRIAAGLPTVVRYGTAGFPARAAAPAAGDSQLFTGGLGGTAVLRQVVALRAPGGGPLRPGSRYRLSGWLGGTRSSRALLTVRFLSAAGQPLGSATLGPVGRPGGRARGPNRPPVLARRSVTAALPAGAVTAQVSLVLRTTLRGWDGYSALIGYNHAVADNLRLAVLGPSARPAPLRPPASTVPRYQHVFLFYLENQDYQSLIGDKARAPYLNSLLSKGSLLADFFAEEHPSDANYLALAGGSAFGVPLTDPLEYDPLYTIRARNIADLLGAAHQSWKEYLQSANGPCDDTVHRSYWDDDLPLLYFADIRNSPARCASHVVPLEALHRDLASAATTPAFSWIGSNDCADMEGCGIHRGDEFLRSQLGAVMRSPAWRHQRSLAIITVDEDNYDHPDPPQRVATVVLGSSGVRLGFVSHVRYTHYSLLRTIEAALGLGTLTANDRYAQPVNDVFSQHAPASRAQPPAAPARPERPARAAGAPRGGWSAPDLAPARQPARLRPERPDTAQTAGTAWVVNSGSGTVTPVSLRTRTAGHPVRVGADPAAIVATPDGRTLYVADSGSGAVTPVSSVTRRAGRAIRVGRDPRALAITPDGATVYVADSGSGTVTPVSTATGLAGQPIPVGRDPRAIAVSPGGALAYVLDWGSGQVTPIRTSDNHALPPIPVGAYPFAITFSPDGSKAFVASYGAGTLTPITVATGHAGRPARVGAAPDALAVSRDGATVYVVSGDAQTLTPVSVATGRAGRPVTVGYSPADVALSPAGATAYVVNTISGTLTPVATATGRAGRPILTGLYGYPTVVAVAPAGPLAVVLNTYGGRAALVNTATGRVVAKVATGGSPTAVAFAR